MKVPEDLNKNMPSSLARYWVHYLTPKEIKEGDVDFEMAVIDLTNDIEKYGNSMWWDALKDSGKGVCINVSMDELKEKLNG